MTHQEQIARALKLYVHTATLAEQAEVTRAEQELAAWNARPMKHDPAKKERVARHWQQCLGWAKVRLETAKVQSAEIFAAVIAGQAEP